MHQKYHVHQHHAFAVSSLQRKNNIKTGWLVPVYKLHTAKFFALFQAQNGWVLGKWENLVAHGILFEKPRWWWEFHPKSQLWPGNLCLGISTSHSIPGPNFFLLSGFLAIYATITTYFFL